MKERPILFSGEMVRAILDGRKTQTRRIVKTIPCECGDWIPYEMSRLTPEGWQAVGHSGRWLCECCTNEDLAVNCPYGQPGDRLWVRETWNHFPNDVLLGSEEGRKAFRIPWYGNPDNFSVVYRADIDPDGTSWKPSIHMPRKASRILLEIVSVRVERLQDISEEEARAEGIGRQIAHGKDLGWRNYLWHGDFGDYGQGNRKSDAWEYQFSIYEEAKGCFSSLWELINGPGSWEANPWVWAIEFKRVPVETEKGGV